MCTGLEIAALGAATSAGGELLGQREDSKAQSRLVDSQNQTLGQILSRTDPLAQNSRDQFASHLGSFDPAAFRGAQDRLTADRTASLRSNVTPAVPVDANISGSAPPEVQAEFNRKSNEAAGESQARAGSLGAVGGFGDAFLRQNFGTADTRRNLGLNNNLAQGDLTLLPILQQYAGVESSRPRSPLPGLLKGVGGLAGSYAGGR